MDYDFEKLALEIVSSRLQAVEPAPDVAAEIAKKIILAAVSGAKVRQDPRVTVAGVCRGVMNGMLLLGKDLPRTAVGILEEMPAIAQATHLDPQELMSWCMEGMAAAAVMGSADVPHAIEAKLEEKFMGVGKVFDAFCRKAAGKPAAGL